MEVLFFSDQNLYGRVGAHDVANMALNSMYNDGFFYVHITTYMLDILLATTSSEAKHCMELFKGFGQDFKRLY